MKKILVIEDEHTVRDNLLELLSAEDFDAVGADDGCAGVELAQQHLPDLIICDVMMPKLDGFGVLESLRKNPATATIPFIFLTAKADKLDVRQGMELGADDYLTKPFSIPNLLGAITVRLNKKAVLEEQQVKKIDELRNQITLSLPNELRSPLNNILGFSQLLINESDVLEKQEIREISERIHRSAERLSRLTQNFLLYAELELIATNPERIEALRSSRINSASSIIEAVIITQAKRMSREADLQLELHDSSIQIAKSRLEKIVEELIDNAFKYSTPGTPVRIVGTSVSRNLPHIAPLTQTEKANAWNKVISTSRSQSTTLTPTHSPLRDSEQPTSLYTLSITNQGRGMTAEQIAAVGAYRQFDRKFYEQQGAGLGLITTKRLVQLLGGELTIESIPDEHTTVEVRLPT